MCVTKVDDAVQHLNWKKLTSKELVPIVFAAALWGESWRSQHVCFHSDNMAVVAILTAGTPLLMHLLRCFSFYSAYYCFHYTCVHIPGVMNVAADALPLFFSHPSIHNPSNPGGVPGHITPRLGIKRLDTVVHQLVRQGVTENTHKAYTYLYTGRLHLSICGSPTYRIS